MPPHTRTRVHEPDVHRLERSGHAMGAVRCVAVVWLAAVLPATAQSKPPEVRVTGVDPQSPARLHLGDALSVKVSYASDQPLHLQATGYRAGHEVAGEHNASPIYGPGKGNAIAWVSFRGEEAIDEVRVVAHDARWKPITTTSVKVEVRWARGAPRHQAAPWARELHAAQQRAITEDVQRGMHKGPFAVAGIVLTQLMLLALPGYFVLQLLALVRWRGGWRRAAAATLVVMLPATGHSLFALAEGSNLWPLVTIFASPIACLYLGALFALRRLLARPAA
jgi:hypothetical protein